MHLLVDYFAVVQIPSRFIREIPFSAIEAEALIDHPPSVRSADFLAAKDHLPRVGVARPQVEDEHSNKIAYVAHTRYLFVGQEIEKGLMMRVSGIARAELKPRSARNSRPIIPTRRHLKAQVRR